MTSPVSSAISPDTAGAENSRWELQAKLAGLGDLHGKKLSPEQKEKKLREACEGFESVFIQKMWQEMRKTVPQGNLLHGREEKFWQDMYDQELAKKMTSAGGIGLADMMYQQLSRNLISATRGLTGMTQGAAFMPQAAPLLPQKAIDPANFAEAGQNTAPEKNPQPPAVPHMGILPSMYEGIAPQHGVVDEPAASNGQKSDEYSAAVTAQADGSAAAEPPEVSAALAQLRLQQTPLENSRIDVMPADRGRKRNSLHSGLDMARIAQREAGTKLGPAAVRPPLHPAARSQTDAAKQHNIPDHTASPLTEPTAGGSPQAAPGQQAPGHRVSYATNIPPGRRNARNRINSEMLRAAQAQGAAVSPPPLIAPARSAPSQNMPLTAVPETISKTPQQTAENADAKAIAPLKPS
ncbi:MAG: rod-binding protein [Desulfovibrio sp.]|jgi:Rod binding domain-containing protein|nr:rod-binding protein [Desulfovibrio sp.]